MQSKDAGLKTDMDKSKQAVKNKEVEKTASPETPGKTLKTFMTKSGNANFPCPACGKVKQMDVSKFRDMKKEIKLKCTCSCKHVFHVYLERRRHIRKDVVLDGEIIINDEKIPVQILDISQAGLKVRTDKILKCNIGDEILVEFTLNDVFGSSVSKEVVVKKIFRTDIGVKFLSLEHYDKLGPYLLFHFG